MDSVSDIVELIGRKSFRGNGNSTVHKREVTLRNTQNAGDGFSESAITLGRKKEQIS